MTTDVPALKALWKQAFGDTDGFIDGFFRVGFSPARCCVLEQSGKPAAALYWFDCLWEDKKIAYIYGVATDMDFRGQGLCRKLMDKTHRHLQETGYAGAVLVPADTGLYRMYEKMGYRGFCHVEKQTVIAAEPAVAVQRIPREEYARLREKLLPAGGIVQGMQMLQFYETYGSFYTADGRIFCAAREEDTLYIQEFLGDPAALPGIVAALDCKAAKLRLPGGDQNFAMYHSFTNKEDMPTYFGIALD